MSRLSREQLVKVGALGSFIFLAAVSSMGEKSSVAHAALNILNNHPERPRGQTIPEPTLAPSPEMPRQTSSEIRLQMLDAEGRPLANMPAFIQLEIPAGILAINTDNFGYANQVIENGQTARMFTQGPNSVAHAEYTLATNDELLQQVVVAHEAGDDLTASMSFSTDGRVTATETPTSIPEPSVTPTPGEEQTVTETPTPVTQGTTATPDSGPTATETPTPVTQGTTATPDSGPTAVETPTPVRSKLAFSPNLPPPISDPLPADLFIGGTVMTDTISVDSSPDGTHVEVADFDSVGSITLDLVDEQPLTILRAREGDVKNYDITIFSAETDDDGFTLSVTTGGSTATTEIAPEAFSSGNLQLNTSEVAQAIADQENGEVQLPVAIDENSDGIPEQIMTIPASTDGADTELEIFLPLISR